MEGEIRMNACTLGKGVALAVVMSTLVTGCGKAVVKPASQSGRATGSGQAALATPSVSIPKPGQTVTIRKGDTVYALARIHSITPSDLIAWNNLSNPSTIYPGQVLKLYPAGSAVAATQPSGKSPARSAQTPAPTAPAAAVTAPSSTGISWRWPADGSLVGRFVSGDSSKQGIDIAGTAGQDVRAAAAGTVVYSGAGLVGYGELIIIKHNDQWLSAYGHNRKRLVSEGQVVRAGDRIAEMGRTGAARDMLHFEVRYNGKPVDPLLYLPKK